ncbi:unnamed protein product, partial [Durusdinium trenchii]
VFLDVDKAFDAFDNAPREGLVHGLVECGVDEGLATLIGEWHSGTRYHYTHLGTSICEQSGKGVRQGCTGAPILWAVLMTRFLRRLSQSVPIAWIKRCLNIFADDLQGGSTFRSDHELRDCLRYLGTVIDCLEELGLSVNPVKTVALLQLGGVQHRKWQALITQRGANGAYLLLPRKNGSMRLKLVSSVVYLGVRVSYADFEQSTQSMRTSAAHSSAMSLSRWLYSKRRLPFRTRLGLWQTCIIPCAEYGLLAVGLTTKVIARHAMNLSALRARVAHVVRGENWQDLQQNREACDFLTHHCLRCGRWCTHLREAHPQILIPGIDQMIALQKNHVRSSPCPFCSLSWKQQHGCPILLQTAILQAELTTSSQADTDQGTSAHASAVTGPERPSSFSWNCHLCSQSFGARVQLTAHLQEHQQQLHRYDPKRDSVEGEPACSHCGLLVTSMDALRNHITKGHCKHFDPRKHVPDHAISPDLKAALLGGRLGPYLRKAGARTFLTVQCLCCGRAFPGLRELSRHLQDKHSILWNEALHLGLSLKQVISPA